MNQMLDFNASKNSNNVEDIGLLHEKINFMKQEVEFLLININHQQMNIPNCNKNIIHYTIMNQSKRKMLFKMYRRTAKENKVP